MGLFGCKACESKDNEILWLRATLEHESKVRAEIDVPGISKRVEPEPTAADAVPATSPKPKEPTFPGYEPLPPTPTEIEVT